MRTLKTQPRFIFIYELISGDFSTWAGPYPKKQRGAWLTQYSQQVREYKYEMSYQSYKLVEDEIISH